MFTIEGQLIKLIDEKTKNGKPYKILQILDNGGRYARMYYVHHYGKTVYETGTDVRVPVIINPYVSQAGVPGINIVTIDR